MNTVTEISRFFSPFLKPYRHRLTLLLIFPVIWCLAETAAPYLIKLAIDNIENRSLLSFLGFSYAFLILVLEFSIRACNWFWIKTFPKIRSSIQSKTFELIQNQPFHFIHKQFAGELINKYQNLTLGFEKAFKILLYGFYPTLLSFFFALAFIAVINLAFALIFLAWFGCMNLVTFLFFNKSVAAAKEQSRVQNRLIGYIGNFICNAITMITFPRLPSEQFEFRRLIQEDKASTTTLEFLTFKADAWRSLTSCFLLVSLIVFLVFGWQKSWITLGDFSFMTAICFYVRRTIWTTALQFSEFFKELGVIKEALLLVPSRLVDLPNTRSHQAIFTKASINFEGVFFGYQDKMLFTDLNLKIPAGQKLGISGDSGVGKTSLIQLLLRLYELTKGRININEQDYRNFSVKELRNLFSYAPQTISLYHCSIFENIAFGKLNALKDEVYEAARLCLCDEFIVSLEKGYDTLIGEGGYKLSGGQRQRIALARAYIKKAPIFILDEALSGLEPDLEENLLERLCESLKEQTLILISHRPSALLKMERVITLKHGQIVMDVLPSVIEKERLQEALITL